MSNTITRDTSKGQLVAYVFGQANVQDSQTNVQMVAADPSGNDGYCSPFAGEVVGIGWNVSAAFSAGVLTVGASFNGTEDADTTTSVTMATVTSGYQKVNRGKAAFAAGTVIGCEYTTDANVEANTVDLTVTIYCLLYLEGI
jgi:hypothetical protein